MWSVLCDLRRVLCTMGGAQCIMGERYVIWLRYDKSYRIIDFIEFISTAQEVKFSIQDFFSKCEQIRIFLWIWPHLLKNSLMENFIFCAVFTTAYRL